MKSPHPYQLRAVADAWTAYVEGARSVVIVSPTGSGKTFMGSMAVHQELRRASDSVSVWLAHREELISQAAKALHESGLSVSVRGANKACRVQVESVQTILARNDFPDGTFLVPDECHHFADANRCGDIVKARPWRILGLTATPQRGDHLPLDPPFERLIVAAQISELQALWRDDHSKGLVPLRIKWPGRYLKNTHLADSPVKWYLEHAAGRRALCFAVNLKAAETYRDEFVAAGVRAAIVKGEMPKEARRDILAMHAGGALDVLVNVGVLTEGYDDPAIDTIILARGCNSQGLFLQIVGRGLRPSPGKTECLLLDMRGVCGELGRPDADRDFSLEGTPIKVHGRDQRNANRICRRCKAPLGDMVTCPECGFETPLPVYANLPAVDFDAAKEAAKKAVAEALGVSKIGGRTLALAGMLRKAKTTSLNVAIQNKFRAIFRRNPDATMIRDANAYNRALEGQVKNQERAIEADARFAEADEAGWVVR